MDLKYSHRANQVFSQINVGDYLILGKNGTTTSYEVLERSSQRGRNGHSTFLLKNIATGEITKFNKKDYLLTATCETDSIGRRKKHNKSVTPTIVTAPPIPIPVPVALPVVATALKVTQQPAQVVSVPLPAPMPATKTSVNAKFSEIGVNVQRELEEILQLFEIGNPDAAIDRLLN